MTPRASLLAFALLALAASPAAAFDCAKAGTPVEKTICADPALKQLDDVLEQAYAGAKASLDPIGQKALASSEKRWVARREYCSGAEGGAGACVRQRTEDRLSLLSGLPRSGPGAPGKLVPAFIVQNGSAKLWDIDISVFRFAEPKTPGETSFNALVDQITGKAKPGPHGEDTNGMTYAMQDELSLTYASPGLLSARHDFYVNEGGAHGMYGTTNLNVDMASGRELSVQDVLSEPSASILALWCKKQIDAERKKRVPDLEEDAGDQASRDATIAQTVRNLASWSIGQEEIVVSFDPYAVGSYAEGAYQCRFPTEGLKRLALPGAPLP